MCCDLISLILGLAASGSISCARVVAMHYMYTMKLVALSVRVKVPNNCFQTTYTAKC